MVLSEPFFPFWGPKSFMKLNAVFKKGDLCFVDFGC